MAPFPFQSVLIANRGEIACRIARTCRRLGLRTVAIYSDADAGALHRSVADQAVRVGAAPPRESYLSVEAILEAAWEAGAEAIHPGYGFLAESPELAAACEAAGLVFVGPSAKSIRALGAKDAAKLIASKAGVPVLEGRAPEDQSDAAFADLAAEIGYPLLVKAVAGGGGRGMRRVDRPEGLAAALAGARRESANAFGADRLLLERLVTPARHIEIQILADAHGGVAHLAERDCSVQRRHQKIVEEAPAPSMTPALRQAMGEAAIRLCRAVGYRGAGTVEFIVDAQGPLREDGFWFMEMNTRLQVEHPVTEAITGLDIVEQQLRIAAGEPLDGALQALEPAGHAVEVRLCAENPARNFLPSPGTLSRFDLPRDGVRVETGLRAGDEVTAWYDNLLAKVVAQGPDRASALAALDRALAEVRVEGVTTNLELLRAIVRDAAFRAGAVRTDFLDIRRTELVGADGC